MRESRTPLAFTTVGIERPARLQAGHGGHGPRLHQFARRFHAAALQQMDRAWLQAGTNFICGSKKLAPA